MNGTRVRTSIDWEKVYAERLRALAVRAAAMGVEYTEDQATRIVAITIREDAKRAYRMAECLIAPPEPPPGHSPSRRRRQRGDGSGE